MFSVLTTTTKDLSWIPQNRYVLADRVPAALAFIQECMAAAAAGKPVAFDIETTGLSLFGDKLVGFSLCPEPGRAAYFPVHHVTGDRLLPLHEVMEPLTELLTRAELVMHNGSFDWPRWRQWFGTDTSWEHDTRMQCILLDSDRSVSGGKKKTGLDFLAKEKLGLDMLCLEDLGLGSEEEGGHNFSLVPTSDALWYGGADADVTLRLHLLQMKEVVRLNLGVVYSLEMKAKKIPAEMTRRGFSLDEAHIKSLDFTAELASIEDSLDKLCGTRVNLNAPHQVADLLFNRLGLRRLKGDSVDDKVLEQLKDEHPVVPLIRRHGDLSKLRSAFLDKLDDAKAEDGRVHLEYDPLGARTGRFSSAGGIGRGGHKIRYNGQTWPKAHGHGFNIRKILIPAAGHVWVSADYSQVELRILAAASGEPSLIQAYATDTDLHAVTASRLLGISLEQAMESDNRGRGKTLNFGIIYGMTASGLAQKLGVSRQEGQRLLDAYMEALPCVRDLIDAKKRFTKEHGFILTEFGRRRWFRDLKELDRYVLDRVLMSAFNTYIQGTAADLNKCGLARVWRVCQREPSVIPISTVHDECNVEVPLEMPPKYILPQLYNAMSLRPGFVKGWHGFPADMSVGLSYGKQHEVPVDLLDKYDRWEPLLEFLQERDEAAEAEKARKKSAAKAPKVHVEPPPRVPAENRAEVAEVARVTPSVVVDFERGADVEVALRALRSAAAKNHGAYRIYVVGGDGYEFLVDARVRVNPTERWLADMRSKGMRVQVYRPAADPEASFAG